MGKITRLTIDEMKKEMPVLDRFSMLGVVGGYDDDDCWWRCMAYVYYGGHPGSQSQESAYNMASAYYGSDFDPDSYAFSGNKSDHAMALSHFANGTCSGQILVFNLSLVPMTDSSGNTVTASVSMRHSVIVTGSNADSVYVFDPQAGCNYTINRLTLNNFGCGFYLNY